MAITIAQAGGTAQNLDIVRLTNFAYRNGQMAMPSFALALSFQAGTPTTYGEIAQYYQAALETNCAAVLHTGVHMTGSKCSCLNRVPRPQAGIATSTQHGTDASLTVPTQVTGLCHLATVFAGPAGRGRYYIPFPGEDAVDTDDTPTAAWVAVWQAYFDANSITNVIHNTAGTGEIRADMVLYHRATGTSTYLNSVYVKKMFATQKRRGDYGKLNADAIG